METRYQKQQTAVAEFRAGVTAALRSWSALKTAVEGQWGGIESQQKAEDLRNNIFENYDYAGRKPMSILDLEDNLALYLEEEFSICLEDNSERIVANIICKMYEDCGIGDFALARSTVEQAERLRKGGQVEKIVVTTEGDMEEDEENETQEIVIDHKAMARDYASGSLFGEVATAQKVNPNEPPPRQLGEMVPEAAEMEVDDDGFAPVATRRSRRSTSGLNPGVNC